MPKSLVAIHMLLDQVLEVFRLRLKYDKEGFLKTSKLWNLGHDFGSDASTRMLGAQLHFDEQINSSVNHAC